MPTKKQVAESNEVKKLFEEITLEGRSAWKCLVQNCNRIYRSPQISTRKRHLYDSHSNVMQSILAELDSKFDAESESSDDENTIRVKISAKRVINGCVEMVTRNGLPFSSMDMSGFVKILGPVLDGLSNANQHVTINRNNIKNHLQDKANNTVERIKKEVKGRFVSIMMDIATRHNRSILGISAQYMLDDVIVIRTLGMDHITSRHTSDVLTDRVLTVLEKYGIEIRQIFAITTDNGSNMLKTTELMNELHPVESEQRIENVLELLNESLAAVSVQPRSDEDDSSDDDESGETAKIADANMKQMQDAIDTIVARSVILNLINAISCAAHTLQLGIGDAFDDDDFKSEKSLIKKCKKLVRALRVHSVLMIIDREKYLRPIKYVKTRWNSIYAMLDRLLTLRPFCEQWGKTLLEKEKWQYLLSSDEWSEVENIVRVLKLPYILTEQLQAVQLTLSDVFGYWITMEIKLQKENHLLAGLLMKHLRPRREKILDHQAMSAAVYLDPRFNRLLSLEKRNEAVNFLQNFWIRLTSFQGQNESAVIDIDVDDEAGDSSNDDNIDEDLLALVRSSDERISPPSGSASAKEKCIKSQLIKFFETETFENVQKSKGIQGYWCSAIRHEYDALHALSRVLLSVPATQVSVERAFSALRIVLNDYRTSMSDESLENILLVRLNWQMWNNSSEM